ncbi:MAG: NADH-quinone oxidoreductase subunit A [Candidatus Melainabacteria bacterium]
MQLTGYPLLFLLLLFAASMPFILMGLSQVLQVKHGTKLKEEPYESGMTPYGDSRVQFDVKFYMYALLFILFDIETIFLFPWAVSFDKLTATMGIFPIVEMFLFVAVLVLGLVYAWRRGALRWQ